MQPQINHTNKLIGETSPYLLQHAHNPVDWHPWGDEAFAKARAEDKPVLVSIGYSACHWCHVMEHESFENEATAEIMNRYFVNIKVDMEERPDVDQIYMTFVQMTTGSGGWPMNVFLTPDKLPFFGGTYFPPVSRYNMPGWPQILESIADAYRHRRDELLNSANEILGELRRAALNENSAGFSSETLDTAFHSFERSFDTKNGGFGGAPKFPPTMSLEFLLRYYHRTGSERALAIVEFSARKMANGGICDQLGGGFHRYAVDSIWLVPHFEKMLYDNAQLIRLYLHLFQITKDNFFRQVAVNTLEYVRREMLSPEGGFYSSQDADSEGVEGKYFVWTPGEITSVLGEENAHIFNFYYDVSEDGNFEHSNILNVRYSVQEAATALKITEERLLEVLESGRARLFDEREKRIKPFRDEKILTAWNGLMLSAFAEAAAVLDSGEYLEIAKANAEFLLTRLQADGRLLRTYKDGAAKLNAYIEDYANLADGLIELYQVTGEIHYLTETRRLADLMITEFWDEESGGFYFTSNDHETLPVRSKDFFDNASPSGNSVAADVFLKLAKILSDDKYERFGVAVLRISAAQSRRYPNGFGRALAVMEQLAAKMKEIVIIGPRRNVLENHLWQVFVPNKVVVLSVDPESDADTVPLLSGRVLKDGSPIAFVCEDSVCKRPAGTVDEFAEILLEK